MEVKIFLKCITNTFNFLQNYIFPECYTIEPNENDDSKCESKYIRNYMRPNFMKCKILALYVTMPKWSDRLPIFRVV